MKVVFLDIDGVLNREASKNNNDVSVDKKHVVLLKELAEKTGAAIVLSSGWKLWFDDDMKPVTREASYLFDILNEHGVALYGKTPDLCTDEIKKNRAFSDIKAKEIKTWLGARDDIESYIVLDDLDLKDEQVNSRLVRVDGRAGLRYEDVCLAIGMLE